MGAHHVDLFRLEIRLRGSSGYALHRACRRRRSDDVVCRGTHRMVQKTSPINMRCKSLGKKKMITRIARFALDKTTFIMGRREKTISFIKLS